MLKIITMLLNKSFHSVQVLYLKHTAALTTSTTLILKPQKQRLSNLKVV